MSSITTRETGGFQPAGSDVAFPSLDGTVIQGRYWAHAHPRGGLVISHGMGEHSGSYQRTAEPLVKSLGIDILAFDYRGSGRSPGKRGVVRDYSEMSLDLEAATRWAAIERPGLPIFLLGHSNGGMVAIRTVLDRDLGLSGLILSNPSLRLLARVPAWKLLTAQILKRLAPQITLTTGLTNEQLTQDPEVMAEIDADTLRHNRISPPLYFGMLEAGRMGQERSSEIKIPTLLILGGSDPVIDSETGRKFFDDLGSEDKTLKFYPEMRHEPLNDADRQMVLDDLVNWLEPRLKPRKG